MGAEIVPISAYEIVVWVSLASPDVLDPFELPRFPALLDTAHTHNFMIREVHLVRWARRRLDVLGLARGEVLQSGRRFPVHAARLWIHPNQPGYWNRLSGAPPYRLKVPEGIIVSPPTSTYPRLPLVGLRAIVRNKLDLRVRGKDGMVSPRTRPWWWPFG
ncbi:MAG TPA: hypothetical protein VFW33_22580 [Gemmataceae bacterium]|nr:hypothetical protein [Gemmataceae bacterium]